MGEFLMPSLGADMEAGTLIEWLKKPGDAVRRGDIIAVVETQKGAIEIEVFENGVLDRYLVDLGQRVPVGTPLALIEQAGAAPAQPKPERAPPSPPPSAPEPPRQAPPRPARAETAMPAAPPGGERLQASPAARRLAEAKGIDLASVRGSGPQGAIVLADITALLEAGAPEPERPAAAPRDLSAMREAIAAAMARSKREIPHYYLAHTVDLTAAERFVADTNAARAPADRLLVGALFVKAVALAAAGFPEFNGHFENGAFRPAGAVHAGVAINIRGGGLVAPAIHDADRLDLDALMAAMRDLVARVRAGRFRASELSDPTITVSSLGERGVETLYGVIYPPQVAIVGFGKPVERAWVDGPDIAARQTVTITLAGDHRVSDGHRGALFLNTIGTLLQRPEEL